MLPGPRKRGSGKTVGKTLRVFPTKGWRPAARIICPSITDKFHTGSPRGIFSHAHVARENDLISLPPAGGKLCEAFLIHCPDPQKCGSGLFFCSKGNEGRGEVPAPTEGLQGVRCGEESPSHGFAVPAPFRQGGQGDGGCGLQSRKNLRVIPRPVRRLVVGIRNTPAQRSRRTDCHSQCAHWLRNDSFLQGMRYGGRTETSAPTEGYKGCGASPGGRPRGSPLRTAWWLIRRADVGIGPYGCMQGVRKKNPPVTALPCQPPLGKGTEGTGVRIATASVRTGFAMTHCMKCGTSLGGRPQGSPLRRGCKRCGKTGRCGHRPLRKRYKECDAVRNPPVTASPCQPPLGKGAEGTGENRGFLTR